MKKHIGLLSAIHILLLFIWGCTPAWQAPTTSHALQVEDNPSLTTRTEAILSHLALQKSMVGIKLVRLSDNHVLFAKNQGNLFHPASTMKLFTTALALESLGRDYRYTTHIAGLYSAEPTTLNKLYIIGSGDPSLATEDLADLAQQLYHQGIRHIDNIICDASLFDDIPYGEGWMWDDQPYDDFAPISGLSLNRNIVELRIKPGKHKGGSVHITSLPQTAYIPIHNTATTSTNQHDPLSVMRDWRNKQNGFTIAGQIKHNSEEQIFLRNIENPALYAGTVFVEECQKLGIEVSSKPEQGITPSQTPILASHISQPLRTLITTMNKDSINLYAELLLKTVASEQKNAQGSAQLGLQQLESLMKSWQISPSEYRFADGSGVSRYGLITPDGLSDLLVHIYNTKHREDVIGSLAIGGHDGDLDWRMESLAEHKNVHAKTGSLSGVSTLAGFIETSSGETLAFSIMVQHFLGSALPILEVQDQLCAQWANFKSETNTP